MYYLRRVDDLGEFANTIHVLQEEMYEGLPQSASVGKRPSSLDAPSALQQTSDGAPAGSNVKPAKKEAKISYSDRKRIVLLEIGLAQATVPSLVKLQSWCIRLSVTNNPPNLSYRKEC